MESKDPTQESSQTHSTQNNIGSPNQAELSAYNQLKLAHQAPLLQKITELEEELATCRTKLKSFSEEKNERNELITKLVVENQRLKDEVARLQPSNEEEEEVVIPEPEPVVVVEEPVVEEPVVEEPVVEEVEEDGDNNDDNV